MARKSPEIERKLILRRDERRRYGVRIRFQVENSDSISDLTQVTLLNKDGSMAEIKPGNFSGNSDGVGYEIELVGYPTASEAEKAGLKVAQALLFCAISLNFGLRLIYKSQEPPYVFDRTLSPRMQSSFAVRTIWRQDVFLEEFDYALEAEAFDRRLLLSMELFSSAMLEANDRTRFIMIVSALEPLSEQQKLDTNVRSAIDRILNIFDAEEQIDPDLKNSLRNRLAGLKRESVRQGLKRMAEKWFPTNEEAWKSLDRAYALRSELLHSGRPKDLDVLLSEEIVNISKYLRSIYQFECLRVFKRPPF